MTTIETKLISFHGDPAVKEKYVNRLKEHRRLEHLRQGVGWDQNQDDIKGCAIGCILEDYNHSLFPSELGLPEWLARLIDTIFEGLPKGEAEQFAEDVLDAIPVGVCVEHVRHGIAIKRLTSLLKPLKDNQENYAKEVRDAINKVIKWHRNPTGSAAWSAVWSAAVNASESAWRAVNASESAWRAESASWSAESASDSAAESARSAAWSAAWRAESASESARSAAYAQEAKYLIHALKECK
tara:strand:+ start:20190 stop:20912 length:723 start_codon:yes stop_codon:yes gene_type:complete